MESNFIDGGGSDFLYLYIFIFISTLKFVMMNISYVMFAWKL